MASLACDAPWPAAELPDLDALGRAPVVPPAAKTVTSAWPSSRLAAIVALGIAATGGGVIVHATRGGGPREQHTGAAVGEPHGAPCTTPIRVRVMYDMTGDTKEVGTAAGKGEHDYLRAINAAGGIRGCTLEIDVQDTRYDKTATLAVYRAWKARPDWPEVSTIFLQGTPMTQALGPLAAEDEKIVISSAYAGELATPAPTSVDVAVPSRPTSRGARAPVAWRSSTARPARSAPIRSTAPRRS
jgi:hypothetical protein